MSIADEIMQRIERNARFFAHVAALAENARRDNTANRRLTADKARDKSREEMSQRTFVRAFGDKVRRVRYTDRADHVGLMVVGKYQGFMVTKGDDGKRKLRILDVDGLKIHVTNRTLPLRDNDSLSNLQQGLLKWVR